MKKIYLILMIVGTIFPYYFLIKFIINNGLNINLFLDQLLSTDISIFFTVDLLISCLVFLIYVLIQLKDKFTLKQKTVCVVSLFLVGLSLALPLMLYIKEINSNNRVLQNRNK